MKSKNKSLDIFNDVDPIGWALLAVVIVSAFVFGQVANTNENIVFILFSSILILIIHWGLRNISNSIQEAKK